MDFRFLFDERRQVFHIGYNAATEKLDGSYYDLLASEARIASLVAIAKGDVPQSHWLHLGRPVTKVNGKAGPALLERHYVRISHAGAVYQKFTKARCCLTVVSLRWTRRSAYGMTNIFPGVCPNRATSLLMPVRITNTALLACQI